MARHLVCFLLPALIVLEVLVSCLHCACPVLCVWRCCHLNPCRGSGQL